MSALSRKQFVASMIVAAAAPMASAEKLVTQNGEEVTLEDLKAVERIAGISFTDEERKEVLESVRQAKAGYAAVRKQPIEFTTEPRTVFTPLGGGTDPKAKVNAKPTPTNVKKPATDEDLAFSSLVELSHLVRTGQISPVELTKLYISRLKRYGAGLLCVITLTEELALQQAQKAEDEIASGHYRSPLHGIPYGIKDLFATKGIPTTWGAEPYENQVFDFDAAVVERLRDAGAVLLGKLSMGALAMNDHWFKGRTANPWNPSEGSSGSSAGSAASTAAGLVGFAIGTETLGSIVSPSMRCRVTGLRPTYGRVSRYGGMALSYTMDKVGPICRQAEDCALVLAAICGADPRDPSAVSRGLQWPPRLDVSKMKIGFLVPASRKDSPLPTDDPALEILKKHGAQVRPVWFSPVPQGVVSILDVESASAFDAFTRGPEIDELKNSSWPQTFRAARYVPAVEYLQAHRARTLLMERFEQEFGDLDAYVCAGGGYTLTHTNLTGHPQIVIPLQNGQARCIVGRLYQEEKIVALAKLVQDQLGFTKLRPDLSKVG